MDETSTSMTRASKVSLSILLKSNNSKFCYRTDTDQFDEALDRRVWSLSDQRLKWDLEIAKKRRGIPTEVENLMKDLLEKQKEHGQSKDTENSSHMDEDDEPQGT